VRERFMFRVSMTVEWLVVVVKRGEKRLSTMLKGNADLLGVEVETRLT
jgi:hypothetical protein